MVRSAAVQFVCKHAAIASVPVTQKQLRSVRPLGQTCVAQPIIQASCALTRSAERAIAANERNFIFKKGE